MSNNTPDIYNLTAVEIGELLANDQSLDLVLDNDNNISHLARNGKPSKPRKRAQPQGHVSRGTQPFPYERELYPEPPINSTNMRAWFNYGASRQHKLTSDKGRTIMTRLYDRGSLYRRYHAAGMLGKTWPEAVENANTAQRRKG